MFVLYSCNNANIAAVNIDASTNDSVTQHVAKNNTAPAESIFAMNDTFQTQDKKDLVLSSLAGRPTVICMIFTNCSYACPKLTGEMKTIADKLNADRNKVNFVMVSFDTDRDTPEQLKKFQNHMSLDDNWMLLHGSEQSVRTLSVLLNVQFEKDAEGDFSHSNIISVLDKNGALAFQKEGLEADQKETVDKIHELVN